MITPRKMFSDVDGAEFEISVVSAKDPKSRWKIRVTPSETIGTLRRRLVRTCGATVPGLFLEGVELPAPRTVADCRIDPNTILTAGRTTSFTQHNPRREAAAPSRWKAGGRTPQGTSQPGRAFSGRTQARPSKDAAASDGERSGWWPSSLVMQPGAVRQPPDLEAQRASYKHLPGRQQLAHLENYVQQLQWRNAALESALGMNIDAAERAHKIVENRRIRTPRLPLDLDLFVREHRQSEAGPPLCEDSSVPGSSTFSGVFPFF